MRKIILAAAAVLSFAAGSAYAGYVLNNSAATNTTVESGASDRAADPTMSIYPANPWQGTESWNRWYQDHPVAGGGD